MNVRIPTIDLLHVADIAKGLKCSTFLWYKEFIVDIDNQNYLRYSKVDTSKITLYPYDGLIINYRELSKFIKSISIETEFDIDITSGLGFSFIHTITETLKIAYNNGIKNKIQNLITTSYEIDNKMMLYSIEEKEASYLKDKIYSMNSASGVYLYKYDGYHTISVWSSMIPVTKTDKLFITFYDNPDNTFYARLRIQKKSSNVLIYLQYLKI